jgi:hypothetical protein
MRCLSAVVTPARAPVSISACLTHACSVCGTQPIRRDRRHRSPQRGILPAMLLHHAHRALNLRRELV